MFAEIVFSLCLLGPESAAIARHDESVRRISAYHLKIETHASEGEVIGAPLVHLRTTEAFRDGVRHRVLDRVLVDNDVKPLADSPGRVSDYSVDGYESRLMLGWDPEHPLALPLEMGRSAKEFSSIKCQIGPYDPTAPIDETANILMLWQLAPGWSLAKIAEACEIVEVPQADADVTRLKIVSTTSPELLPLGRSQWEGMIIDLDHRHGWLISRMETPVGSLNVVSTVTEFREGAPGLWYPAERQSMVGTDIVSKVKVIECQFNQPIDNTRLVTQFPEGARVDVAPDNLTIHIWGQGKPERSFTSMTEYSKYMGERVRKYHEQERGARTPPPAESDRMTWVYVANVILISLILLLTALRRRV